MRGCSRNSRRKRWHRCRKPIGSSTGRWIEIAARSTVFAYDKTKLSAGKLPKSLLDLSDPAWKGRWAASPSGADFQAIVSAMLALKGEGGKRPPGSRL